MSVDISVFDRVAAGELSPEEGAEILLRRPGRFRNWIDRLRSRFGLLWAAKRSLGK